MKFLVAFCLFAVAVAVAKPQYQAQQQPATPYEFSYKVDNPPTNTYFGQNESGDVSGNKVGTYYVLLPDGRTMTVNYVADSLGYVPKISFQGGTPVAVPIGIARG